MSEISFQHVHANGIRLHVAVAGPDTGDLLILLHGFPEFWFAWHKHIGVFAAAGYRVLAPDQRGYNLSDKPRGPANYRGNLLVDDVLGLIAAMGSKGSKGKSTATIVGHDWGAFVAWQLALHHPDRVTAAVVMDVPHPKVMRAHLRTDVRQMLRSWYMALFQLPRLPEFLLTRNQHRMLEQVLVRTARPGTFTPDQLRHYQQAWGQPNCVTSMLNWYRAGLKEAAQPTEEARYKVAVPMLILWGKHDAALRYQMAHESALLCEAAQVEILDNATHWLHHEEPARVQELTLQFLRGLTRQGQ